MNKIKEYLEEYEELWQEMSYHEIYLPVMDISLELIDDNDYYDCNFTGEKRLIELFFTGSSNYFPGFWVGQDDYANDLDKYPIYIFDLGTNEDQLQFVGNFKTYMSRLLIDYLELDKCHELESIDEAKEALEKLDQFSDSLIEKGYYELAINECNGSFESESDLDNND